MGGTESRSGRQGLRRARRVLSVVGAVVVSAALLAVMGFGYGAIPALGPALDPGRGAWTSAAGGAPVTAQALDVPGLTGPVTVSYTKAGLASINAGNDHDLFLALGYVHAKFRLSQMDLERREGEGQLAQLAGPSAVSSDEFELRLGLLRTAQNEWERIDGSPGQAAARHALLAYAQGVNDDIAQVRASGDWPALFTLTGAYPAPWTPVDSLVVQGDLTQELDYTTEPLDYAILERSLGATNAMKWLPVLPANTWTPYDPGPYNTAPYIKEPLTPLASGAASSAPAGQDSAFTAAASSDSGRRVGSGRLDDSGAVAEAAGQLLSQVSQLPAGQVHQYPDSNAWAVNGPAVTGGGALLGGDPHLPQTLPSVWYEVALSAPGYQVAGASVPGVPGVLLGRNAHIAWSLTDTQNQAAFYYAEKTRGGDEYYWQGAWRPLLIEHYTIPVRGAAPVHLTVDITADGPIMDQEGQQMAVDWMGNVPSDDLTSLLEINQASDFTQFKAALSGWRAPTQNFTYSDNDPVAGSPGQTGNIGVYAAGYYPQAPSECQPWLPMPGDGACDLTGVIPYTAIPQVYDPPAHVVATDNQRPVSASYPYYVGTSDDFYDPGYRAAHAYSSLESSLASGSVSAGTIAALQNDQTDSLAAQIVPQLLTALKSAALTPMEKSAASLLTSWDDSMSENSAAATVWWQFWSDYLAVVFDPWWKADHVPVQQDRSGLLGGANLVPLVEDLQAWTLAAGIAASSVPPAQAAVVATADAAFRGPSGKGPADASAEMLAAFSKAVTRLSAQLGDTPSTWTWGRVHSREFPSLAGAAGLGYGPRAAAGDPFTEDAADGGLTAIAGPSWRMVATLNPGGVSAEGVYPGGQSENPASPWYSNLVSLWWNGQYLPVPAPGSGAGSASGGVTWSLHG
jgi:penicillin amidase